jgi:hypothetical protein
MVGMTDLADDLLTGAGAIAGFIGATRRRAFYLLERGELPAFKLGNIWHARKSAIRNRIEELEGASLRGDDRARAGSRSIRRRTI